MTSFNKNRFTNPQWKLSIVVTVLSKMYFSKSALCICYDEQDLNLSCKNTFCNFKKVFFVVFRGLKYKCSIHTKMLWTPSFKLTVGCIKREMNMRMRVPPCQLHVWPTHISNSFSQLTTLRGDAVKLLTLGFSLRVCHTVWKEIIKKKPKTLKSNNICWYTL